ncbi:hypothetical protein GF314_00965, partial [bacterium]|nr:hypothetical protein [bacterium]
MAGANDHLPDVDPSAIESREQAERAVTELREAVRHHDRRYHVEDDPVISDREYDRFFATLDELEQAWDLVSDDSPTRRVGAAPREELATVRHPAPMLSLEAV